MLALNTRSIGTDNCRSSRRVRSGLLGIPVIIKFGPLKERAALFTRNVARVAHPEIFTPILPLALDNTQHARDTTATLGREARVHVGPIIAIRNIDALVPRDGVRTDGQGRGHGMLPFFLHLGVHHQQRVVWEMDGDLALRVGVLCRSVCVILW